MAITSRCVPLFNQPGHPATVVAFDLPINDLIPRACRWTASVSSLIRRKNGASSADKEAVDNVSISFNGLRIEITTAINTTGMRLVWVVPFSTLLMESLQNILLPLLLTIGLLALTLFGFYHFPQL